MATVLGFASVRMKDDEGIIVAKEVYFDFSDASTLLQIQTFLQSYLVVLDGMSNAEITNLRFEINLGYSGLKGAPVVGNGNDDILLTDYVQNGSFYHWGDAVPSLIDAVLVNGRIDLTNTAFVAYTTFMTAAHAGFNMAGRMGPALLSLSRASKRDRKQRKQVTARSTSIP